MTRDLLGAIDRPEYLRMTRPFHVFVEGSVLAALPVRSRGASPSRGGASSAIRHTVLVTSCEYGLVAHDVSFGSGTFAGTADRRSNRLVAGLAEAGFEPDSDVPWVAETVLALSSAEHGAPAKVPGRSRHQKRLRRQLAMAVVLVAFLATMWVVQTEQPGIAAPPDFKAPFACGTKWFASTYESKVINGEVLYHQDAVDFNAASNPWADAGLPVYASASGTVIYVDTDEGAVVIDHGGGWSTAYWHMADIPVQLIDSEVTTKSRIGVISDRGFADGAHLHYEQRQQGSLRPVHFDGVAVRPSHDPFERSIASTKDCAGPSRAER